MQKMKGVDRTGKYEKSIMGKMKEIKFIKKHTTTIPSNETQIRFQKENMELEQMLRQNYLKGKTKQYELYC